MMANLIKEVSLAIRYGNHTLTHLSVCWLCLAHSTQQSGAYLSSCSTDRVPTDRWKPDLVATVAANGVNTITCL